MPQNVSAKQMQERTVRKIDLLINATSMNFQINCELQLDLSNTICYDLNYRERHNAFSD